jgi:hypothetical protein
MTTATEATMTEEWIEALEERGYDPESAGASMLLAACESEGIEPGDLCDALQGETTGWSEESAGRNYAMELADDLGSVPDDAVWPCTCIDWDAAWRELSFDGFSLHRGPSDAWFVLRAV